jgi:hypothetical protein
MISDNLLYYILAKHSITPLKTAKISEIKELNGTSFYITYNGKILPFEKEWYYLTINTVDKLIPTDKAKGSINGFKQFATAETSQRYINFDKPQNFAQEIDINKMTPKQIEVFEKTIVRFVNDRDKPYYDEFAYKDAYTRKSEQFRENVYINNDNTTNYVIMSQLSNPKRGCDAHQGRVHWRNTPDAKYQSLASAYEDGYEFPNCRHSMSLFYPEINTQPKLEKYEQYEDSERKRKVDNSAKIRKLEARQEATTDPDKIKEYDAKIKAIKKDGYMPFRLNN